MPDVLENPVALILLGAAISLVTSVAVTGFQARLLRRSDVRNSSRSSARSLTSAFIAERDSDGNGESFLAEAEMTVMTMTDRKTRDRLRDVIRLLRERSLPEVEELSGVKADRARRLLCDHALEVLGAHLRSERIPELSADIRRMLSVEEEALSIRSGEAPKPDGSIPKGAVTPRPRHTGTKAGSTGSTGGTARKTTKSSSPRTASKTTAKNSRSSATAEDKPEKESAFWDD